MKWLFRVFGETGWINQVIALFQRTKENAKYKYELFSKEVLLISNFNEYFRKVSTIVFYLVPSDKIFAFNFWLDNSKKSRLFHLEHITAPLNWSFALKVRLSAPRNCREPRDTSVVICNSNRVIFCNKHISISQKPVPIIFCAVDIRRL